MAGRRLLLMHVTTSSGHHHASRAIAQGLKRLDPCTQVVNVDAFDYTSRIVRLAIMRSYMSLIRYQPNVWEYMYDNPAIHSRVQHLRRLLHRYQARKLQQLLETVQPHAIACTQAFPCGMVADFKRTHNERVPLIGVLTDYAPHLYWLHEDIDVYVVPADDVKARFVSYGVAEDRLRVYGIPVMPSFLEPVDRATAYHAYGLDPVLPVVLIMGGGGGFGPFHELMASVDRIDDPCQFVVLTGTNHGLLSWFKERSFRHRVVASGYVEKMAPLMDIAAAIITKPGGLTTAETLAKQLPMLMISPIPGQEMCNARYLVAHDAAVQLGDPHIAGETLSQLLHHPARLRQLREHAGRIAHPDSALRIAELLLERADSYRGN